jgi:hypothetical protein
LVIAQKLFALPRQSADVMQARATELPLTRGVEEQIPRARERLVRVRRCRLTPRSASA